MCGPGLFKTVYYNSGFLEYQSPQYERYPWVSPETPFLNIHDSRAIGNPSSSAIWERYLPSPSNVG
jgi:hypothetical protein